ncbi:hypothetical protein, partial [Sulfurihydrogenibium sp.]|uniref:hypothetical protein n=1 Tax=Sulfurihydrogenibium sp. TaxID=2053621 RepID=UPI0026089473
RDNLFQFEFLPDLLSLFLSLTILYLQLFKYYKIKKGFPLTGSQGRGFGREGGWGLIFLFIKGFS